MAQLNRDVLGYLRRALRMGADPPRADLIGLLQPVVPGLAITRENVRTFSETKTTAGAAGETLSFDLAGVGDRLPWMLILGAQVTIATTRTAVATLVVNGYPQVGCRFYSGATNTLHVIIGMQGAVRSLLIPPNLMLPGAGTNPIEIAVGAAAAADAVTLSCYLLSFDHDDPLPWIPA